jgi:(S)-2-hydroxyglutarate dehydrogenase
MRPMPHQDSKGFSMPTKSIVIIGGGIVGLSVAREATAQGFAVTVIEKEEKWAQHQTGRNSGVIHAGPYYAPGSFKAKLCTAGNSSMYLFAEENNIPVQRTGKLIVATSLSELSRLENLAERAKANKVPSRLMSASEAREIEPFVSTVGALFVQSTGIIDYGSVSERLAELAKAQGAEMILSARVHSITSSNEGIAVVHSAGETRADYLINCAGLYSDHIARMAGVDPQARIIPFRGEYFELNSSLEHLVNGLIYPVPDPAMPFLGVHLTRMIKGGVHVGPNAVTALAREGYSWKEINIRESAADLTSPAFIRLAIGNIGVGFTEVLRSFSKKRFAHSLSKLVPGISAQDLVPSKSGVRAQAVAPNGKLIDDFLFVEAANQLHVLNAPSPAATSSLEIAKLILEKIPKN